MPNLSLEHHMRRLMREVNYILVNIKTALKYMNREMFRKMQMTYIQPKLEYAITFWSPHLRRQTELLESP